MYEPLRVVTQPLSVVLIALVVTTLAALRTSARPRWRRSAVVLALMALVVCHPYAAWSLARALEAQYPPASTDRPAAPSTLVVLSGGLLTGTSAQGELSDDSLARTVYASRLARRLDSSLIVVTGGVVNPGTSVSAAQRMRDVLADFGIPDARLLVEPRALTTVGNARESWALLAPRGIRRVGLVTDAIHMPRSAGIFRAVGFDVVPLPCCAQTGGSFRWSASTLAPGPRAAWLFNRAAHEWISLTYYRLIGDWR